MSLIKFAPLACFLALLTFDVAFSSESEKMFTLPAPKQTSVHSTNFNSDFQVVQLTRSSTSSTEFPVVTTPLAINQSFTLLATWSTLALLAMFSVYA